MIDTSPMGCSSWFTGFTDSEGHFGIKIVEARPKSDRCKRAVTSNISLKFRLDQRFWVLIKLVCCLLCKQ